jgi:hypothetical protein
MRYRQFTWRLAAGLIVVGTAADATIGFMFLTSIVRAVSFSWLQAIDWIPPAIERPLSLLHLLARLNTSSAWMVLLLTVIFSLILAQGLWKEKQWAGWVETALMLYLASSLVNRWIGTGLGVRDFFKVGNGPALVWALTFIALVWSDQLKRALHGDLKEIVHGGSQP